MAKCCFADWMWEVDSIVEESVGLSVYDLEDCCFRDWYDSGMSAQTAAKKAVRNSLGEDC